MADRSGAPIDRTLARWHDVLAGDRSVLDEILHDDVVFLSPVVFTPQRGKEITKAYLSAAGASLAGSGTKTPTAEGAELKAQATERAAKIHGDGWDGRFRYRNKIVGTHGAALDFETMVGTTYVNGVDLITVDDDGLITEFKVMVRPLQAVDAVHQQMKAALGL